jgi:hypothetical protein
MGLHSRALERGQPIAVARRGRRHYVGLHRSRGRSPYATQPTLRRPGADAPRRWPMFFARSHADLHNIRLGVNRIKTVSDRIVGVGPVGIGLDGVLAFVPGVGALYSAGAALMLMLEAVRARASIGTLIHMGAVLAADTVLDIPGNPITGVIDAFFTGHKWSANVLLKHMDETHYIEGTRAQARDRPEYADLMAKVRSGKETRRIVFLG